MSYKRYAVVGLGGRVVMFLDGLADTHRAHGRIVGFCDLSQTRMDWHNRRLKDQFAYEAVPTFHADQFDEMIRSTRPDVVIVTTVDATHHVYICRAMELGCDVICEKPMTTDAPKAREVLDAVERTGRSLRVTFNVRYTPMAMTVKELILSGVIGRPLTINFLAALDTCHGADYFRRWHAEKAHSGGLIIHKSTHHLDLVNWWLDARPQTVYAMGDLMFYGRSNAEARGERYTYDRYTGHPQAKDDPFALRLDDSAGQELYATQVLQGLYLDAEAESGYVRDRNVFGDHVDIEDAMSVLVRYKNRALLNYSLVAFSPWEGFRISVTGTRGRLELHKHQSTDVIAGPSDAALPVEHGGDSGQSLWVHPLFGKPYEVAIPKAVGGHGGGDPRLLADLFSPDKPADPLNRAAGPVDGAAAMLIGACANESFITGLPVQCDDLMSLEAPAPDTPAVSI